MLDVYTSSLYLIFFFMVIYDKYPAGEPGELKPEISCVEHGVCTQNWAGFLVQVPVQRCS